MTLAPTLRRLVAPLSVDGFFDEQWSRRSLHLRGEPSRFDDLRPAAGWESWLSQAEPVDAAHRDERGGQVQTRIAPSQAPELFAAGRTICADVSRVPEVAALLAGLRADLQPFQGEPFAKLYASPPGAGFAPHIDAHHVFVVQLSGKKRWRHGATPVRPGTLVGGKLDADGRPIHTYPRDGLPMLNAEGAPLAGLEDSDVQGGQGGGWVQTELLPGDVLYLPPGTWHTTEALEVSVALSISPPRTTIAQLLAAEVRDRLEADARLWSDIVAPAKADGRGPPLSVERAVRFGLGRLRKAVEDLQAVDMHLRWARETFAASIEPTRPAGADASAATPDSAGTLTPDAVELRPDDRLTHAPGGFVWLRARDPRDAVGGTASSSAADVIFLFRPGVELVLPVHAERFIKRLHGARELTLTQAAAFEPAWPLAQIADLLADLLEAGVLVRAR